MRLPIKLNVNPYRAVLIFHLGIVALLAIPTARGLANWQDAVQADVALKPATANPIGRISFKQTGVAAFDLLLDTGGAVVTKLDITALYSANQYTLSGLNMDSSACVRVTKQELGAGRLRLACDVQPGQKNQLMTLAHLVGTMRQPGRLSFIVDTASTSITTANPAQPEMQFLATEATAVTADAAGKIPAQVPVFSSTHPRDVACSDSATANFQWLRPEGASSVKYEINGSPDQAKNLTLSTETQLSSPVEAGTTKYLHIQSQAGSIQSQFTVYPIVSCLPAKP